MSVHMDMPGNKKQDRPNTLNFTCLKYKSKYIIVMHISMHCDKNVWMVIVVHINLHGDKNLQMVIVVYINMLGD